jgi:serine/threonine protein kinase
MHPEELVGQTLGHYKIKRRIGYGGMSTVFLADDIHLGREVALKVFWPRQGETQDFLRRFTREARVLAQLDHPNILPVYDYGKQGELAFLVTPYMAGGTLKELLQKRKALPPSEAVQLISQVLPALQYAHDRNLIHRDIKPGNLLFKGDGSVMLADFGLVKVLASDEQEGVPLQTISETGLNIAGTPEYMSPEQIDGHALPASDIYSLGMVLYEMVAGTRPFQTTSLLSMLLKQANEAVRSPRELNPYISPQLEAAIMKALEKDPRKRFARATDFLQALQQIGNPASQAGNINASGQTGATGLPLPGISLAGNDFNQTIPTSWAPQPVPATPNVPPGSFSGSNSTTNNPNPWVYSPVSPSTTTIANSQPGIMNGPQPVQRPMQQPTSQPGNVQMPNQMPSPLPPQPVQPSIPLIQAFPPQQTIMPPFVPQQPRRSRAPLITLLMLCVLLVGVIASLFLTPLGSALFSQHPPVKPQGKGTVTLESGTQTGRGIRRTTPGGTEAVSTTLTDCPANNAARAAVVAPLTLGNDPTIAYIVNEANASGEPTSGTLKLFDTVNGKKTELVKIGQAAITEAQISDDGQWILFSALIAGRAQLRMIRLDGQGMQTLLCAPSGLSIRNTQWSIDQRYIIFDEFPQTGEPTVYLLNTQTGALQAEVTPSASGPALVARTWLDNNRVLMVGVTPNSDAPPQNIYILNLGNGAQQSSASITPVFTSSQPCWDFDSSYDGQTLFITQCMPGTPTGTSTLSMQPATGGALSTIMNSTTLAIDAIRVIDPAGNKLLALASNSDQGTAGSEQKDGLYVIQTNGSGSPLRLTSTPAHTRASLNVFSQYFWSNLSRNTTMYALETVKASGNGSEYMLSYGQVSGGTPSTFTDDNQYMAIVGWTTT